MSPSHDSIPSVIRIIVALVLDFSKDSMANVAEWASGVLPKGLIPLTATVTLSLSLLLMSAKNSTSRQSPFFRWP